MTKDDRIATTFTALAHPRRVRLFRLLCEQPELGQSLLSLQRATGYKDAPLIHHLRIMERAGLITRRRTGATMHHSVSPGRLIGAMGEVDMLRKSARSPLHAAH
jgi:DNA-binding transcriptional ArsR family regulator